ncbi:MAG: hypothetical protein J07HR59_00100, partial [Halorubrum sp. J07HR59]
MVLLGIRSLLPALAESVCVSVALTSRASSHVSSRAGWAISP